MLRIFGYVCLSFCRMSATSNSGALRCSYNLSNEAFREAWADLCAVHDSRTNVAGFEEASCCKQVLFGVVSLVLCDSAAQTCALLLPMAGLDLIELRLKSV